MSLSLSLFWGPYSYIMCTFFFFLARCIICTNGWRKKNFLYKIGIFFIFLFFIFYTLLHYLIEVNTIFFTQLFKRLPFSAANNNWFNRQRCHIVKFYLEFCLMMILSPIKRMKHKLHSISNARSLTHLVNLSISSSSSRLHFSYYGRNYGFD